MRQVDKYISRLINEVLHQVDIEGIRRCIEMAVAIGFDLGTKSRSNQKAIVQMNEQGYIIQRFESASQAARTINGDKTNISHCCNGRKNHKTAYGYIWKYEN